MTSMLAKLSNTFLSFMSIGIDSRMGKLAPFFVLKKMKSRKMPRTQLWSKRL